MLNLGLDLPTGAWLETGRLYVAPLREYFDLYLGKLSRGLQYRESSLIDTTPASAESEKKFVLALLSLHAGLTDGLHLLTNRSRRAETACVESDEH